MMQDQISVCICTYKRPVMLAEALEGVASQVTDGKFSVEMVIVDNDCERSAEKVVKGFVAKTGRKVIYDCEPEQNISLARNRAVAKAAGNLIAFLDDDEVPIRRWLQNLYKVMMEFKADGALGPVVPFFPPGAPAWLKEGKVLERHRLPTGSALMLRDCRTGNMLVGRSALKDGETWFDPAFGRTGREDMDFFRRQIAKKLLFVWSDEAIAYETVPPERWYASFHLKKYLRFGTLNGEGLAKAGFKGMMTLMKTMASIPVRLFLLIIYSPLGKPMWIRPAMKLSYSVGVVLAYFGISLIRYRD